MFWFKFGAFQLYWYNIMTLTKRPTVWQKYIYSSKFEKFKCHCNLKLTGVLRHLQCELENRQLIFPFQNSPIYFWNNNHLVVLLCFFRRLGFFLLLRRSGKCHGDDQWEHKESSTIKRLHGSDIYGFLLTGVTRITGGCEAVMWKRSDL